MKQRRKFRRIVIRASIFLLLVSGGAFVNIAVAWGCAIVLSEQANGWNMRVGVGWLEDGHVWSVSRDSRPGHFRIKSLVAYPMKDEWDQGWKEPGSLVEQWSRIPSREDLRDEIVEWHESASGWPVVSMWSRLNFGDPLRNVILPGIANARVLSRDIVERGWLVDWSFLPTQLILPLGLIWPGFAINTLFYAAILWLLLALPGALRRWRRIKRSLCPACAYPVGTSDLCTECGKPVPSSLRARVRCTNSDSAPNDAPRSTHP